MQCVHLCQLPAAVDTAARPPPVPAAWLALALHLPAVPLPLRSQMQDWILGCDICQEVCPWNRKAPLSHESELKPIDGHNPIELRSLFEITDEQFRARFRKTPLWRPKRRGILRNAAIALGNKPHPDNLIALALGISDCEPLVRGAAAWALGEHRYSAADEILRKADGQESLDEIRQEIADAILRIRTDKPPLD